MVPGVAGNREVNSLAVHGFSGIANVEQALKGIPEWKPEHNIFFELTACAGSCVNGPKAARNTSVARRRYDILQLRKAGRGVPRKLSLGNRSHYSAAPVARNEYSEQQLQEALRTVGKYSADDELNCGGCGYDSCRDFAHALIAATPSA
jgi:iron only hydrogenase large subunit-like protein